MMWFFSDPHYHHRNIVRGESEWTDKSGCRDFNTLLEHDMWLLRTINAKVQSDDVAYCLGDWSFGGKDRIFEFRSMINCKQVHLVLGNHDHHMAKHPENFASLEMFTTIRPYVEVVVDGLMLVLSHYPIESWNCQERGSIHLHGHVHGNLKTVIPNRWDVGMDALGVTSIEDLKRLHVKMGISRHTEVNGGNSFGY